MRLVTIAILCLAASVAFAQLTVVSTTPANLATNVTTGTMTFSITFSAAVDTTSFTLGNKGPSAGIITSLDTVTAIGFSGDKKTVTLTARTTAGTPYFVCLYYAKSAGSSVYLDATHAWYFTTAASFPTTTVSGSVNSGTSGVGTAGSFVALSSVSLQSGDPKFVAGTVADGGGNFVIPYVPNGTLYPLAAKDLNNDGQIDPSTGDVVGTGNQIVVNNANISGVVITFASIQPFSYKAALDTLNKYSPAFPTPNSLRMVQASSIDSTGAASRWEFYFTGTDQAHSFIFQMESFANRSTPMDAGSYSWVTSMSTISALPTTAAVDTFLARAERGGGYAYRPHPMTWNGFDVRLNIGQVANTGFWDMTPNQSLNYLGVTYWYGQYLLDSSITYGQRRFLGDYGTGTILGTTAIQTPGSNGQPEVFALEQNYPNPFNPATNVEFSLPSTSRVDLRVYNMLGQEVATLVNGTVAAGRHTVSFDGSRLASGVYLCRIVAGNFVKTMKMTMVK